MNRRGVGFPLCTSVRPVVKNFNTKEGAEAHRASVNAEAQRPQRPTRHPNKN